MWDHDIGALPVLEDNNQVIGVITDRDITNAVAIRGKLAADISVGEAMSLKLYTCSPDDRVRDAIDIMRSAAVRRLPVVDDDNRLIGFLTINDIISHLDEIRKEGKAELSEADIVAALNSFRLHH